MVEKIDGTLYRIDNRSIRPMQLRARRRGAVWVPQAMPYEYKLERAEHNISRVCVMYHFSRYNEDKIINMLCQNYETVIVLSPNCEQYNEVVSIVHSVDMGIQIFPHYLHELRLDYIGKNSVDVYCMGDYIMTSKEFSFLSSRINFYITMGIDNEYHKFIKEELGANAFAYATQPDSGLNVINSFLYSVVH